MNYTAGDKALLDRLRSLPKVTQKQIELSILNHYVDIVINLLKSQIAAKVAQRDREKKARKDLESGKLPKRLRKCLFHDLSPKHQPPLKQ